MPKISKAPKVKNTAPKKNKIVKKTKTAPVKKKVVKKVVKKITPPKTNRIVVDVISDEEIFGTDNTNETLPVFSSWPDFNKTASLESQVEVETDYKISEEEVLPSDDENYDKQKKFFSDWASQIKSVEGQEKPMLAPKKSVGLYRKQALFYLGATAILLFAVFYLFFSKLTIMISPQGETVNDSLTFNISGSSAGASSDTSTDDSELKYNKNIDGEVSVVEVDAEKTYQTSGEEVLGGEDVSGTVIITNKSAKAQPLVAKTRLLSPDGKLFRLKDSVSVPAGGVVTANIYADKPSTEMAITTPTRFTIPGLWAGLQDRIYAENSGDFVYQTQVKKYLKQADIDNAKKDINEVLNLKAKNDLKSSDSSKVVVYGDSSSDGATTEFDAKLGDEKTNFTVKAKKQVVVVVFSKEKAASLAEARLSLLVPDDKQLANFNKDQITYSLENFDPATKLAVVKAYFSGSIFLKSDSTFLDRKKLVGLNSSQISQYLNSFPEIKDYDLKFSPPFIKTAPTLPDRINIEIKNAQ
ncbi:MAG: hypothetical protein WCK59_02820 [Candidatus Falkowbacteria bacterium]